MDAILGKRDDELDSGPGIDHLVDLKRRTLEQGKQIREEIAFDRSDGLNVYDVTATPLREGPDDAVTGVITASLNISEQKRREQLLRSRERKAEMLYKVTGQLLTTSDREAVFSQIHSVLREIFEYTLCAVGFEQDGQLFPVQASHNEAYQTPPERPHDLESGSISARAYRTNETVVVTDVETLDNAIAYGDIRAAIGIPIAGHGVITVGKAEAKEFDSFDLRLLEVLAAHASVVLDRLDREDALIEAKEDAEAAARFKSSMMANMSHEIRTPLTSIIGFAELLADKLEGKLGTFAEKAHKSGNRLMKTLNSVLELSRLEAGSYELPEEQVALSPIVEQTTERLRPQARRSNVDVATVLPDYTVKGTFNEEAVRRILENLLENAIKFTPAQGTITVRLHANEDEAILEVEDTGIGIHDETLPKIFEAFRQESEGLNREYEGSGLGLSIVRELTEALEGDLEVETEKNEGSRFVVRLPRTRDDSA